MEILIREIEENDYLALLPLWNQFGGYATVENIVPHYNRIKDDERYKTFIALFNIYLNSDLKRTEAHTFYEHNGYSKHSYGFGKTINPIK